MFIVPSFSNERSPLPIDLEQGEIPTGRKRVLFVRDLSGKEGGFRE